MIKKILCIAVIASLLAIFSGCASQDDYEEWDDPHSREAVEYFASRKGFGGGRTDVETVALEYLYNSTELAEKYGDAFCVEDFGGSDEGTTVLFSWLYKGEGDYFAIISGDQWNVHLTKGYFGKWSVTECYQEGEKA